MRGTITAVFCLLAAGCEGQARGTPPDGGSVDGAGPDADTGADVMCECSGSDVMTGGAMVVPDSGVGPCGQPSCEDDCGHEWKAACGSLGEWTCQGGFPPPPACLDASQD